VIDENRWNDRKGETKTLNEKPVPIPHFSSQTWIALGLNTDLYTCIISITTKQSKHINSFCHEDGYKLRKVSI
jgi:hypothetical protein